MPQTVIDSFTRTHASSWESPNQGQTWVRGADPGGLNPNVTASTQGTFGRLAWASGAGGNGHRMAVRQLVGPSLEITGMLRVDKTPGTQPIYQFVEFNQRPSLSSNSYRLAFEYQPGGGLATNVQKIVNGPITDVGTLNGITIDPTYTPNTWMRYHLKRWNDNGKIWIAYSVWEDGTTEPTDWSDISDDPSGAHPNEGFVALSIWTTPGTTNFPFNFEWDNYMAVSLGLPEVGYREGMLS